MAAPTIARDVRFDAEAWRAERDWLWARRVPEPHIGYSVAKRAIDVGVSAALLLLAAPLFGLCAALVLLTSPGPVLFRQERRGIGGRPFSLLKFRTMVVDAEARIADLSDRAQQGEFVGVVDAPAFKAVDDPRITPVGRYLRRTCLDELPQLVNVLRGEMSLVGPRPLVCAEADVIPDEARVRLAVRPGLTCIWQTARTADTTFEERMRMDAEYVRSRSLRLDLRLLARTPLAVMRGNGIF